MTRRFVRLEQLEVLKMCLRQSLGPSEMVLEMQIRRSLGSSEVALEMQARQRVRLPEILTVLRLPEALKVRSQRIRLPEVLKIRLRQRLGPSEMVLEMQIRQSLGPSEVVLAAEPRQRVCLLSRHENRLYFLSILTSLPQIRLLEFLKVRLR